MKKQKSKFAQFRKKHFQLKRETKGLIGSLGALAALTAVATIFQFAKSDEFSDIDALLAEVENTTAPGSACDAMIDGAELTKRHMFQPYRQEISVLTQDQTNVALGVMRDAVKDISREDWLVMATISQNLRRVTIGRERVNLALADRRSRATQANHDLEEANSVIANAEREEMRLIVGDPVEGEATTVGRLRPLADRLAALENEFGAVSGDLTRAEQALVRAVSAVSGILSTNRMAGESRAETRRRTAYERRGGRQCMGSSAGSPFCQEYRNLTESRDAVVRLNTTIEELRASRDRLNTERTELSTRIAALEASRAEAQARFAAQREAAATANRTFGETVASEIAALETRALHIENLRAGLERQLNFRGNVLANFLRPAHEDHCRRDRFLSPETLAVRYSRESWLTGRNSEGHIPFVSDCLRYSEVGYDSHDGTMQVCRLLPRLERMEGSIVDQAGSLLGADFYRSCVQIDLARIDPSFFDAQGEFVLSRVGEILVPSEDWLRMTNRQRGHLAYEVIDTVRAQLTSACHDRYLERRFRVSVPDDSIPALVVPVGPPTAVLAPTAPVAPAVEVEAAAPAPTLGIAPEFLPGPIVLPAPVSPAAE